MTSTARYFLGAPHDMGRVTALDCPDFPALCETVLLKPVQLDLTREQFRALPKKEQNRLKNVGYITPCTFKTPASVRSYEHAAPCNLLCLDIDSAKDALRLLKDGFGGLGEFAHVAWHTASSTPEAPRLRVVVSAEGIPVGRYAQAVRTLASLLALDDVTHESLVPVQPMYLPVRFKGETY